MNRHKPNIQRTLFESGPPAWNTLTSQSQQPLTEIVSQLLLDALQQRQAQQGDDSSNNSHIEDSHVA